LAFKSKLAGSLLNYLLLEILLSRCGDEQESSSNTGHQLLLSLLQQHLLGSGLGVKIPSAAGVASADDQAETSERTDRGLTAEILPLLLQLMAAPGNEDEAGARAEKEAADDATKEAAGEQLLGMLEGVWGSEVTPTFPEAEVNSDPAAVKRVAWEEARESQWRRLLDCQQRVIDALQVVGDEIRQLVDKVGEIAALLKKIVEKRSGLCAAAVKPARQEEQQQDTAQVIPLTEGRDKRDAPEEKGKEPPEKQDRSSGTGKVLYWRFPESQTP